MGGVGDHFERPYGEGSSSKGGGNTSTETFRVYCKGLVSKEWVKDGRVRLGGIGVAIFDSRDDLIYELRKPLIGNDRSRWVAEAKALIEGLNAAIALDLKRVMFFCDYHPLYQFVSFHLHYVVFFPVLLQRFLFQIYLLFYCD